MGDLQLAIAVARAYEGDNGPVLREILQEKVLPEAASDGNRWMASWAFWMLGRRDMAVRSLIVCCILTTCIEPLLTRQQSPIESLLAPTQEVLGVSLFSPSPTSPMIPPWSSSTSNYARRPFRLSKEPPKSAHEKNGNLFFVTLASTTGWAAISSLWT
jgi:hypothetical protein